MTVPVKLASFGAILTALFAGGALAGEVIDPDAVGEDNAPAMAGHGAAPEAEGHGAMPAADPVHGLAVAAGGLRLELERPELRRGRARAARASASSTTHGAPVRDFDVTHEKRMHLIVVRRDLTGFQHLHPTLAADGTWSTPVTLAQARLLPRVRGLLARRRGA